MVRTPQGLVLKETAPGVTIEQVLLGRKRPDHRSRLKSKSQELQPNARSNGFPQLSQPTGPRGTRVGLLTRGHEAFRQELMEFVKSDVVPIASDFENEASIHWRC